MKSTRIIIPPDRMTLDGMTVSYTVRRSARAKHIRITISAHKGVVITIPSRIKRYINPEQFLREKQEWVLKHLSRVGSPGIGNDARLDNGSTVTFEGRPYTFRMYRNNIWKPRIEISDTEMLLHLPSDYEGDPKETVKEWIKSRAAQKIEHEVERYARIIGVEYNRLAIRDQKTKWGSCSKQGNLSFNWRLALFPPKVLRYVVIHELCHIRHFNHSDRFWSLVERYDPHYRESVNWLKEYGLQMEGPLR
jgi:predicted metal-dependent hydrolase